MKIKSEEIKNFFVTYGDPTPPKKTKLHSFFFEIDFGKMVVASLHKYRKKRKKVAPKKEKKF